MRVGSLERHHSTGEDRLSMRQLPEAQYTISGTSSITVGKSSKIVKIVQNPRLGPCSAPDLSRRTRPVALRMRPRGNYNVRPFTWSRNFFHPTTSRGAVPGLREMLKSSEILRDIPKCYEFHLDFSFFYRQFSQQFVGRKFGPRKHNTVQNAHTFLTLCTRY